MGCEDVVVSVTTTAEGSIVLKQTLEGSENQEAQVGDEALPLGSALQNRRLLCREDEFPSFNSPSIVNPRPTSKRAASLDLLEYVLPYEEIAQLGCKGGAGKSFWKNLRFWQRTDKGAPASSSSSDFKVGGQKLTRPEREVLGPLYTAGNSPQSDSRRSKNQQQQPCAAIDPQAVYMYCRSDGNVCSYVPLNRCPRIPCGPLYFP